jgi:hypothetical protein
MPISNALKNMVLDSWYKSLTYLGGIVFVISLFHDFKGITNVQAQLLSLGFFFFGLGEWKNLKVAHWIKQSNAYSGGPALIQMPVRSPDVIGLIFDIIGIILIILGTVNIIISVLKG